MWVLAVVACLIGTAASERVVKAETVYRDNAIRCSNAEPNSGILWVSTTDIPSAFSDVVFGSDHGIIDHVSRKEWGNVEIIHLSGDAFDPSSIFVDRCWLYGHVDVKIKLLTWEYFVPDQVMRAPCFRLRDEFIQPEPHKRGRNQPMLELDIDGWGVAEVFEFKPNRYAAFAVLKPKCGDDAWCYRNPRPLTCFQCIPSDFRLLPSRIECVASGKQGLPQQKDAAEAGSSGDRRHNNHPEGPKRHVLLGLQILIGGLLPVVGVYLIRYTGAEGRRISVLAGIGCFFAGVAAILIGVSLILTVGLVQIGPLP